MKKLVLLLAISATSSYAMQPVGQMVTATGQVSGGVLAAAGLYDMCNNSGYQGAAAFIVGSALCAGFTGWQQSFKGKTESEQERAQQLIGVTRTICLVTAAFALANSDVRKYVASGGVSDTVNMGIRSVWDSAASLGLVKPRAWFLGWRIY